MLMEEYQETYLPFWHLQKHPASYSMGYEVIYEQGLPFPYNMVMRV